LPGFVAEPVHLADAVVGRLPAQPLTGAVLAQIIPLMLDCAVQFVFTATRMFVKSVFFRDDQPFYKRSAPNHVARPHVAGDPAGDGDVS